MNTQLLRSIAVLCTAGSLMSAGAEELPFADTPDAVRPINVGDTVPDASLTEIDGKPVQLHDALRVRPTILVFFRGGWCPYCVNQLSELQEVHDDLNWAGYQLIAISPDSAENVTRVIDEKGLRYTLLRDSNMQAIRKFGLAFGLDAATLEKYKGYGISLQSAPDTDAMLLPVPAVFLVDTNGTVLYRHFDPDYTQRMDASEVVAAARLKIERVSYLEGDTELEGFLAMPRNLMAPAPGVMVVHEWYGLNDYARDRTVQLAEAGYVAFAADIYGKGRRAGNSEEAGKLAGEFKDDRGLMRRRAQAGLAVLRDQPLSDDARLAAIGFCFGGTCVLELARDGAELAGVVSFHGGLDTPQRAGAGDIKAAVLICHGADDPYVPAADVAATQEELRDAGADWEFILYGGAVHSFTNPKSGSDPSRGAAYNPIAAARAWQNMLGFFGQLFAE